MPTMTIRIINSTFETTGSGDYESLDHGFIAAVSAGLEFAITEIKGGSGCTIVEIAVDLVGRRDAARGAVAISTERFRERATVNSGT